MLPRNKKRNRIPVFRIPAASRILPLALALSMSLTLAACGGGGGASGSSDGSGSSSSTASGAFTLSTTSAAFKALRNGAAPADVRIGITVTGNAVATVGVAAAGQSVPSWLDTDIEGTLPNLTLVLHVTDTAPPAGRYTATLIVGTAGSNNAVLATGQVDLTYDVIEPIVVTATPRDHAFVFGSSLNTAPVTVTVAAGTPDKQWTITSNQAWLPVSAGTQTGDGTLSLVLNGAATEVMPGGRATAQLVVQNTAEPIDRHVVDINADIIAPHVTINPAPVVIGGASGHEGLTRAVDISFDTGSNAYPWTVSFDAPLAPGWVASSLGSGNISAVQHSNMTFGITAAIGAANDYTATAHFDVVVLNQTFRTSVPVTTRWHGQRLVAERDGIAFSSVPSRPQPTPQTIRVTAARGIDAPWTATSNSSWLSVTPGGITGDTLTLNANPTGLATNTVHVAEVTLASTCSCIERAEKIRVAMWVGATNPANLSVIPGLDPWALAMNPVEPYAYYLYGSAIHVFNVYTGAEIATYPGDFENISNGVVAWPTSMEVSSDGALIFVANGLTQRLLVVNAATGQTIASHPLVNQNNSRSHLYYARTDGHPVLYTPFTIIAFDVEANAPLQVSRDTAQSFYDFELLRAVSPDGRRLFMIDDASSSDFVSGFGLVFSVAGGRALRVDGGTQTIIPVDPAGSSTKEICVSASGTRLYTHNGRSTRHRSRAIRRSICARCRGPRMRTYTGSIVIGTAASTPPSGQGRKRAHSTMSWCSIPRAFLSAHFSAVRLEHRLTRWGSRETRAAWRQRAIHREAPACR